MYEPLIPARLAYSEAGVPWSEQYGDLYHSAEGGPGQARHVFLRGNRLPERWQGKDRFVILETGFGTGLNFLATWSAWRDDPQACRRLHYISAEKHPFPVDDLAALHAAWPEFAEPAAQLRANWPTLVPGCHRLELAGGRLILTLLFGDAGKLLGKLRAGVDAFYLDGFTPAQNPDLWSPALLGRLGEMANRGASLATWSVAVPVRNLLHDAGFRADPYPGFGRKKEMLAGRFVLERPNDTPPERRAIVLGAGVAGSTCCERLASRGWQVTLIDRRPGPGMEASGNLAGIVMPLIARDDNIAARLSRAAYLYGLRAWQRPEAGDAGARLAACGVMQFARTPEQEAQMRRTAEILGFPDQFLRFLSQAEAADWLGHAAPAGGWLFPQGGWANPPSLCRAALALAGERVQALFERSVGAIERAGADWRVFDDDGHCLAEAPTLILASGVDAIRFEQASRLPIQRMRGQVTLVPEGVLPGLRSALCRDGYAAPAVDGLHAVGASYDADADPLPRAACDADNLRRLSGLLPGIGIDPESRRFASRVGFRPVPPDRLPIAGPLPDWGQLPDSTAARLGDMVRQPGLYGLLGYASRGLVWANLLAETLASQLAGEPLPLETDLLDAVDPGRFALRAIRKRP
ncbi:MAG: bifunctional tRNA (5-methylaminomethyl-2-thiouridine)(34)-methyltransferase MnmD/FAD-dependent 5-carboxymethylaminomethyl-2-thiouridine(34) oxidoreductase MnmC [Gallionellaceae bacterium]|nr:bifunctional tRNA (5-methylaminomethyl-2-thiouridine)(34)-methyltransferase MnmD/FAD-dependent 5-carboxymethylaminomethyl-2-thiouridine(34) oxidoreductase MnmC [Gallionellaceae bacterium]